MNGEPATKADLQRLGRATKEDIASLARSNKEDVENLARATKDDIASLARSTKDDIASLARLVENISGSLQEEMRAMRDEVREGFNRVDSASRRHGALLASGTIAIAGLTKSATKRDTVDKRRDAEIRDLKARVKKLESIVNRRKAS